MMAVNIKSVLIIGKITDNCGQILRDHGITTTFKRTTTRKELLEEIAKYDALVLHYTTLVTEDLLNAGTNLKVLAWAGNNIGDIDCAAAEKKNIRVINAPGAYVLSACELTCSLILNLARNVLHADSAMKKGLWETALFCGTELYGKTLAIIGLGRVGREVAMRMHAFGMKVVGFDPFVTEEQCFQFYVTKMELEEIWPLADYITLHTRLTESTHHFINETVLSKCKDGVKIVNITCGELIHTESLLSGIMSRKVSGAALDVFEGELPTGSTSIDIVEHPSIIATPRLAASSNEANLRIGQEIAEQIVNMVKPGTFNTAKQSMFKDRLSEAKECMQVVEDHLNNSIFLKNEIKTEMQGAVRRLFELVKEADIARVETKNQKLINPVEIKKEPERYDQNSRNLKETGTEILKRMEKYMLLLQENNKKIETLQGALKKCQKDIKQQKINYKDVAPSTYTGNEIIKTTINPLPSMAKDKNEKVKEVKGRVEKALNVEENGRVYKTRDWKIGEERH